MDLIYVIHTRYTDVTTTPRLKQCTYFWLSVYKLIAQLRLSSLLFSVICAVSLAGFAAYLLQLYMLQLQQMRLTLKRPSTVAPTTAATYKPTIAVPRCPQIYPAGPVGPKGWTENYALT